MFIPRIVKCDQGSGDERIIKSKLNPSGNMGNTTAEVNFGNSRAVSSSLTTRVCVSLQTT